MLEALKVAIDLQHVPSGVRQLRSDPLPSGVLMLLRIAAGDEDATNCASEATGRSREAVGEAVAFFIEQILLCPDADSYRVLGAGPDATSGQLRQNMALLLRWLHPDIDHQRERSIFVKRVTLAWNDLKTQERRAAYDQSRRISIARKSLPHKKSGLQPKSKNQVFHKGKRNRRLYFRKPLDNNAEEPRRLVYRLLLFLLRRLSVKNS